ncbi:MAG: ankyrin repeat domain-containing protein, partial [Reyranella sp.]|nr:ankyrin repeat domain-containing protein [Reyranella sp.]
MLRRTLIAVMTGGPVGAAFAQVGGTELFGEKQIVRAVQEGDDEKVRAALLRRESPNQTANNGVPLLIVAVQAGHVAVFEVLLKG